MSSPFSQATILIPLLRQQPQWLAICIESALAQSVPCDVIVLRSHTTPQDNLDVLREFSRGSRRLRDIVCPPGCGYACVLNLGIGLSVTERVGFLLADDWLDPRALQYCLRFDTDIVSTSQIIYAEDGETELEVCRIDNATLESKSGHEERADYLSHFLLFRRSRILEAGGLDTTIGDTGPDDYDLLWTLFENGASASVVEEPLYCYRDHEQSWRLTLRSEKDQLENLEKILNKHNYPEEQRGRLLERHKYWYGRTIQQAKLASATTRWESTAHVLETDPAHP